MPETDLNTAVADLQNTAQELDKLPVFAQPKAAREILTGVLDCMAQIARRLDALTPYLDEAEEGAA